MLRLHPSCALDINKQNPSEIHKRYILYACFCFRLYLLKSRKKPNKHTNFIAFMFLSVYSSKYVSKLM